MTFHSLATLLDLGYRGSDLLIDGPQRALAPQLGTSKRAPGHKIYSYLLRKLAITRATQVWALDTGAPCRRGLQQ